MLTAIQNHTEFLLGSLLSLAQLFIILFCALTWSRAKFGKNFGLPFLIASFWIPAAVFALLIPLGAFTRLGTTVTLLCCAAISQIVWQPNRNDASLWLFRVHIIVNCWTRLAPYLKVLAGAVFLVFLLRLARGLIAPPLAWDALTYHLLKAARWVQNGAWVWDDAPFAWRYYEYFPPLGDVYWAWAMLGSSTDAWLASAGAIIWCASGYTVYYLARVLGVQKDHAFLATLAALSAPANLALLTSAYVDTTAAMLVTAGSALAIVGVRRRAMKEIALATVAMALATGTKITFFPYLLVTMIFLGAQAARAKQVPVRVIALSSGAVAVALFWQIYLLWNGKSPFYPVPFSVAGIVIETGNPEFVAAMTSKHQMPYWWEMPRSFFKFLFQPDEITGNHYNYTWTFLPVLISGLCSLAGKIKGKYSASAWTLLAFFVCGFIIFLNFWGPATSAYRNLWLGNMGRFFLPFYFLLLVLVAATPHRTFRMLLALVVAVNVIAVFPKHFTPLDYAAVASGTGVLLLCFFSLITLKRLPVIAGVFLITAISLLSFSRSTFRHKYYGNTATVFDVQRLTYHFPGEALPYLDSPEGTNVAYSADYGGSVYTWFRYPLMGSHLQNRVHYLPATNYFQWQAELKQRRIKYYVVTKPLPIEKEWIDKDKETFRLITRGDFQQWFLYSVNE